jgi:hypothetical protein
MIESTAPTPTLLERLGPRARRRAAPRLPVALAGAGCALAVAGAIVMSIDGGTRDDGGSFNRWPGVLLTALVVAAGFAVQHLLPRSPLATAGTVAVVLGTPAVLVFATLDPGDLPPWSTEAILIVSTLAYAAAYLVGPGRGRPAYLGAAAIGLWASVLQVTEKVFDLPFQILGLVSFLVFPTASSSDGMYSYSDDGFLGAPDLPDPTSVGILSTVVGVGLVLLSRRLDRRSYAGAATPLLVAAFPALYVGMSFLTSDLDPAGSGLLAIAIGMFLSWHGSTVGRRATTWLGAIVAVSGVVPIILDLSDTPALVGVLLLVAGCGTIAGAHLLAQQPSQLDEMAEPVRRRQLVAAPPTSP